MSLIDLLGRSTTLMYHIIYPNGQIIDQSKLAWLISIDIIFRIIFIKIFLKLNLHKHHKLSILLLIISFLPMTIGGIYHVVENHCSS